MPFTRAAAMLLLFVLAGAGAAAPPPPPEDAELAPGDAWLVDRWSVDDGLPVNGVTALHRDPGGFLWLATFDGLTRFDGRRFVMFDSAAALGTRRLIDVRRSPDGALWVLSERFGLARLDGQGFVAMGTATGLPDARVIRLFDDADGSLLAATFSGIARWNGQRFETLLADSGIGEVQSLLRDEDGDLWIGQSDGTVHRSRNNTIIETHHVPQGRFPALVTELQRDRDGGILAASRVGVARIADGVLTMLPATRGLDAFSTGAYPDGRLLVRNNNGNLWLPSSHADSGRREPGFPIRPHRLLATAPDGALWTNAIEYVLRDDVRVYAAPCPVRDLLFDAQDTVWLASACEGLVRLRPRTVEIVGRQPDASTDAVYGIAQQADGALWIASLGAVERWRDGVRELRLAPRTQGNDGSRYRGIDTNYVRTVFADRDGSVFVGQRGVCKVEGDTCVWPAGFPDAMLLEDIRAIHRARDGSLWLGGSVHLWQQTPTGEWRTRINAGAPSGDAPRPGMVRTVQEGADGTLWFGTLQDGIWRRAPDDTWTHIGIEQGLPSASVRDLLLDADGTLWIATEDRGLCRREVASARIACVSSAGGLYSDSLHRILDDGRGRLWLNSNRGAFWLTRDALDAALQEGVRVHPRGYTRRDGLPNQEGNGGVQGAGLMLADGRVAFPTQGGVAVFDPDEATGAPAPPLTAIEALELPDGRSLPGAAQVDLGAGERSFAVRLAGLSPVLTDPLYFRYRLLPDSDLWQDIGDERLLHFSRLAPGTYTVEVAALDATSGLQGDSTRVRVTLPPWWWETLWFRASVVMLLFAITSGWFWRRTRAVIAHQRELEARVEARTAQLRRQQHATEDALQTVQQQGRQIALLAQAKSRFFANVSHELRTPLAVILGPLRDAARGRRLEAERIDAMLRNGRRLERLIEQMLDLERIDARRFPLHPVPLDAATLLRDAVSAFEPLAREAGVALHVDVAADAPTLHADEDQIARVLGNLLSNALKFTPRGGRVQASLTTTADGHVRVTVEDSGPGVPEDWRERIFDRFAQVGHEATRSREGAGLGLALCREIVALHGGRLWVEAGDGGGACFVLVLPDAMRAIEANDTDAAVLPHVRTRIDGDAPDATELLIPEDTAAALQADAVRKNVAGPDLPPHFVASDSPATADITPLPDTTSRLRVLIAEDNTDLRAYLRDILSAHFDVDDAEDGAAALALARERLPDVVVSDLTMPRLDGFGLARALRADPTLGGVPLIFLTARASDSDEVIGLDGGADHYLRKPFDAAVLLAHVRAALNTVRRLHARFAAGTAPIDDVAGNLAGNHATVVDTETPRHPPQPAAADMADPFLQRAHAWLDAHLHDETLRPEQIAHALHVSRATLDRRFTAGGESLAACLRRLRLQRAQALLATRGGTVSEVAYACGFPSLSAFSHAYRKQFGRAPSSQGD